VIKISPTVYANFRDKPALLAAVFDRRIKTLRLPDLPVESNLNLSLERLAEFGERVVGVLRPEVGANSDSCLEAGRRVSDHRRHDRDQGPTTSECG
jgi:AcrR family transcriptional regulator